MHYTFSIQRLAKYTLVTILIFAFLEGGVRIATTIYNDHDESGKWYIYSSDLGWERRPGFNSNVASTKKQFDSNGYLASDTQQISDTSKPKIIFIGDSVTFGYNVATPSTFVELLDTSLPSVSVINLGVIGYTSYQGYKTLLKYGLQLNPSLLIVSFNYNDRRYVLQQTDIDSNARFTSIANSFTRKLLDKVYLLKSMRYVITKSFISTITPKLHSVNINDLHPRVPPSSYRRNLVRIAKLAREKQIPLIFMLLKDNPALTKHLRQGIELFEKSEYDLAAQQLKLAARASADASVIARKYLAKIYKEIGDEQKAKEVSTLNKPFISLLGGYPLYPDTVYNEIMIAVAHEYSVSLLDAGRLLEQNPANYHDFCHPNEYGHQQIYRLLYNAVSKIHLTE